MIDKRLRELVKLSMEQARSVAIARDFVSDAKPFSLLRHGLTLINTDSTK